MFTNFDIKNARYDSDTIKRLSDYEDYRNLYDGDFTKAFSSTVLKIRKRYPLDNTTASGFVFNNEKQYQSEGMADKYSFLLQKVETTEEGI